MKTLQFSYSLTLCFCIFFADQTFAVNQVTPGIHQKSLEFRQQLQKNNQTPMHTWPTLNNKFDATTFSLAAGHDSFSPHPLIRQLRGETSAAVHHQQHFNRGYISLNLNYVNDYYGQARNGTDDHAHNEFSLDGSSVGVYLGNWGLSIGAVDRWWGPAWQSPLIMSNNARPIPALSLDRLEADAAEIWGLKWLGPWRLNTFVGQLESDRDISRALIWGFRASAMPIPGLELGLSRAALFGGGSRDVNSRVLLDVITGSDNASDQPGNQLGALDIAYRFSSANQMGHEFYLELAGEDEAGAFPAKKFATLGYTGFTPRQNSAQGFWHYLIELSDTTAGSVGSEELLNVTYRHHIYTSGYTHHGQVIGSPLTGDTQGLTLGVWLDQGDSSSQKTTGAWLINKRFADNSEVNQLSLWTQRPCGPLACTLTLTGFDEPVNQQQLDPDGDYFAASLGVSWQFPER